MGAVCIGRWLRMLSLDAVGDLVETPLQWRVEVQGGDPVNSNPGIRYLWSIITLLLLFGPCTTVVRAGPFC